MATIAGGAVTGFTVTDQGGSYTSFPRISIDGTPEELSHGTATIAYNGSDAFTDAPDDMKVSCGRLTTAMIRARSSANSRT